jgi:hypothetical protein
MSYVSTAIEAFIEDEIRQNRSDITAAVRSREWILSRIENEIGRRTDQPQLYVPEPFVYFGSYFKRTQVADVDEFDVLVVVDSNTGVFNHLGFPTRRRVGVRVSKPKIRCAVLQGRRIRRQPIQDAQLAPRCSGNRDGRIRWCSS